MLSLALVVALGLSAPLNQGSGRLSLAADTNENPKLTPYQQLKVAKRAQEKETLKAQRDEERSKQQAQNEAERARQKASNEQLKQLELF